MATASLTCRSGIPGSAAAESSCCRMMVTNHQMNTPISIGSSSGKSSVVSRPKRDFFLIEPTMPTPSRQWTKALFQGDSFLSS